MEVWQGMIADRLVTRRKKGGVDVINSSTYPFIHPAHLSMHSPFEQAHPSIHSLSMHPCMHPSFNSSPHTLIKPPITPAILHLNHQCIHLQFNLCTDPFNHPTSYLPTNPLASPFIYPPVRGGGWKLEFASELIDRWIYLSRDPPIHLPCSYTHTLPDKWMDVETGKMYGWAEGWRKGWVHRQNECMDD